VCFSAAFALLVFVLQFSAGMKHDFQSVK